MRAAERALLHGDVVQDVDFTDLDLPVCVPLSNASRVVMLIETSAIDHGTTEAYAHQEAADRPSRTASAHRLRS